MKTLKPDYDSLGGRFLAGSVLAALVLLPAVTASADELSSSVYQNNTGLAQTQFNFLFQGSVSSLPSDVNPFGASGSVSFTPQSGNTLVSFMGPTSVANGASADFGLDSTTPPKFINAYWGNTPPAVSFPSFSVSAPATVGSSFKYVTGYANVTSGGQTVGQWFEVPYTTGAPPTLNFANYTGATETLNNVGFFLSPTEIPLDNLNYNNEPPPGAPLGSTFTPLPQFSGIMLNPDSSINASVPDGSSTLGLLALAAAGLFASRGFSQRGRLVSRS